MSAALLERELASNPAVAIGNVPNILSSICRPDVQIAWWQRQSPFVLEGIDALNWGAIDDIDADIAGPDWAGEIAALLCEGGYPPTSTRSALADELADRTAQFATLMRCDRLNLRLEVIETDACRKFHMDYVTARLLLPLHGPGTQWVEAALGEDAPIRQLGLGDVAIFKGRRAVEIPAILHRSPPIVSTGETRLLLALSHSENKDELSHDA